MIEKLKNQNNIFIYTILFFLVAAIGYSPVYLQGKSLIWEIDGIGQYYPAFLYIGKFIRSALTGGGIPSYDLSIAMGENIVGCLNYYGFGDPINLLAVFANQDNGQIVFAITYIVRLYIAGLAMIYYLRTLNVGKHSRVIATLGYCFCGFTLFGCTYYIEWLSALILLPLMLAQAELYINKKGNPLIFSLVICYGALCGFYYLYMTSLALAVYCTIRIIAIDGKFDIKHLFKTCITLFGWYLLGLGLAAPILFQALAAFLSSERNSQALSVITNISNYIPGIKSSAKFVVFSIVPKLSHNFQLGITVFHWTAVLFIIKKVFTRGEKKDIQVGVGILLTIIAVALPITGYIFNGFGESNTRWLYLVHFFAAVILAVWMEDLFSSNKKIYKCICVLIVVNVIANTFMVYSNRGLNLSDQLIASNEVYSYVESPVTSFKELSDDDEVYRIDHDLYTDVNGRPDNIAMLNAYNGFSYWFSIINSNSQNYTDWDAKENLKWRSFGFGDNAYTATLVGSKYYCAKGDSNLGDNFTYLDEIESDGDVWRLYKNNLYKGFIYECKDAREYDLGINGDFEEYNRTLYDSIDSSNISGVSYKGDEISFSVNIDKTESNVVIAIPYNKAWKATVDGEEIEIFKFNGMMAIEVSQGEHVVKLTYSATIRNLGIVVCLVSALFAILYYRRKPTLQIRG